jgi:hypothetical protein
MPQPPPIHISTPAARSRVVTDSTSSALITPQALPAIIPDDPPTRDLDNRVIATPAFDIRYYPALPRAGISARRQSVAVAKSDYTE